MESWNAFVRECLAADRAAFFTAIQQLLHSHLTKLCSAGAVVLYLLLQ